MLGQTVLLIGGVPASVRNRRRARSEGATSSLWGRPPLERAAADVDARSTAAFDATDSARLDSFFTELPEPVHHVLVTAGTNYYARLADVDFTRARGLIEDHLLLPLRVARASVGKVEPAGTLLFMGASDPRPGLGSVLPGAISAALPVLIANLALELAPVRVNLIAAASSTPSCPPGCSATTSTSAATSCARRSRSGASSDLRMSPRWPSTS